MRKKIFILVSVLCCTLVVSAQVVTTLAGSDYGYVDGIGTVAQFNALSGVCTDATGAVYVTDGNRIRKITPAGVVTTFAGSGTAGYVDGIGTVAQFNLPLGVCADAAGNVYVADANNNRIRKITSSGVVTTLAGSGAGGIVDGTGTAAQFFSPQGVCTDAVGNVYVADSGSHRIRKINSAGVVTTVAGSNAGYLDGIGTTAKFYGIAAICIDATGNLYVSDNGNKRIRKITPAGEVTTFAGSGVAGYVDGTGSVVQFSSPYGLCIDANGNLYVTDSNRIRKITQTGIVSTLAGNSVNGYVDATGNAAQFDGPQKICTNTSGNLYVTDGNNKRIRKITPVGVVTTLAGSTNYGNVDGTGKDAQFEWLNGICTDATGNVYVADYGSGIIKKITSGGVVTTFVGTIGGFSQFTGLDGVCIDANGNLYVADDQRIRKITPAGVVTTFAGSGVVGYVDGIGTAAQFTYLQGICTSTDGSMYVTDKNRIRKITPAGVVSTLAGSDTAGFVDGMGDVAQFNAPLGVCADTSGNLYVADTNNGRIRKITPAGVVSTLAGSGTHGYTDGIGTAAQFAQLRGICTGADGSMYVTDENRIRKITPAGVVTTFSGSTTAGYVDGMGTTALFNAPKGVCTDASGNFYVSDSGNKRIRKLSGVLGINQNTIANGGVTVYPNPTKDHLHIDLQNELSGKIIDLTGKTLMNVNTKDVDVSTLSAGIYLLEITSEGKHYVTKIVKE